MRRQLTRFTVVGALVQLHARPLTSPLVGSAFAAPRPLAIGVAYHRPGAPVVPLVRADVGIDAVLLCHQVCVKLFFLVQIESGRKFVVEQKFVVVVVDLLVVAPHVTGDCLLGKAVAAQRVIDRRRVEAQARPLLYAFATTRAGRHQIAFGPVRPVRPALVFFTTKSTFI